MMFDPAGKRVVVMGLGRFGGGVGVARWLATERAEVLVTDLQPADKLADSVHALDDLVGNGSVTLRLGEHRESDFAGCEALVVNPAVPLPWTNPHIRTAREAGALVTTEIGLLVGQVASNDAGRRRTIGITGSAGKSTTAAMLAHALRLLGQPAHLGGNIGGSLLERLDRIGPADRIVLELSSAMLHWLCDWSPGVAVVTNLLPNHLDWHGSPAHYAASKHRITTHQRPGDTTVLGASLRDWPTAPGAVVHRLGQGECVAGLAVPGVHNAQNAALARTTIASLGTGASHAQIDDALRSFPGLAHRLCLVGQREGVRYYDDSKSTTPQSTLLALDAFASRGELSRVHLVAGGYDKGSDLTPIAARARGLAGLYCIGATGATIAGAAQSNASKCTTLDAAMAAIAARVRPGDIVLLSPGCASWDQFENFEQRGLEFARLARQPGNAP